MYHQTCNFGYSKEFVISNSENIFLQTNSTWQAICLWEDKTNSWCSHVTTKEKITTQNLKSLQPKKIT